MLHSWPGAAALHTLIPSEKRFLTSLYVTHSAQTNIQYKVIFNQFACVTHTALHRQIFIIKWFLTSLRVLHTQHCTDTHTQYKVIFNQSACYTHSTAHTHTQIPSIKRFLTSLHVSHTVGLASLQHFTPTPILHGFVTSLQWRCVSWDLCTAATVMSHKTLLPDHSSPSARDLTQFPQQVMAQLWLIYSECRFGMK